MVMVMMMMMPGIKLAYPPPPAPYLDVPFHPSGGTWAAIYCVYKGPRSKQKGSTIKKEEKCHTQETKRGRAHTQSQSSPMARWGMRDWFPRNTIARTYMSPQSTQIRTTPCDGRSVHNVGLRLGWRRHRCREHRLWCARMSGAEGAGGGACPCRLRFSQGRRFTVNAHARISEDSADRMCGSGTAHGPGASCPAQRRDDNGRDGIKFLRVCV